MKNILLPIVMLIVAIGGNSTLNAQKGYKFGHINSQELLQLMPERIDAEKNLKEYAASLETELQTMEGELNTKYQTYLTKRDSLPQSIRAMREQELQSMQQRIQNFSMTAQEDIQQKESDLLQPIIDKAKNAIEAVGKENGFTYIFDLSMGSVLFHSADSEDITPLVKAKLGLQ